jgi:hypothetical protein
MIEKQIVSLCEKRNPPSFEKTASAPNRLGATKVQVIREETRRYTTGERCPYLSYLGQKMGDISVYLLQ